MEMYMEIMEIMEMHSCSNIEMLMVDVQAVGYPRWSSCFDNVEFLVSCCLMQIPSNPFDVQPEQGCFWWASAPVRFAVRITRYSVCAGGAGPGQGG